MGVKTMRLTTNNIEFLKEIIVYKPWKKFFIVKLKSREIRQFDTEEMIELPHAVKNFIIKHGSSLFENSSERLIFIYK